MPEADPADVSCLLRKIEATGIKRERYWDTSIGQHEVTFAYNLITLEVKWYSGHRDGADDWKAELRVIPEWMTGTVDWMEPAGRIDDLKTGRWPVSAKNNRQLYSYSMPWWLELGQPIQYRRPLSITQWPRYPLAGLPRVNRGAASGIGLAAHLEDLRWSLENPDHTEPSEDTCRFCDGKTNCGAFLASGISFERGYNG